MSSLVLSAEKDGEKTELKKANNMYMAVELEEGHHTIQLIYCTPYIKTGAVLTLAGLLLYFILVYRSRRKKTCR